jgi:hypothetical protein
VYAKLAGAPDAAHEQAGASQAEQGDAEQGRWLTRGGQDRGDYTAHIGQRGG